MNSDWKSLARRAFFPSVALPLLAVAAACIPARIETVHTVNAHIVIELVRAEADRTESMVHDGTKAPILLSSPAVATRSLGGSPDGIPIGRRARLEQVRTLLASGRVGEGNRGLLVSRAELTPEETAILDAENADRTAIYRVTVANNSLPEESLDTVGEIWSVSLAEKLASGEWYQTPEGDEAWTALRASSLAAAAGEVRGAWVRIP